MSEPPNLPSIKDLHECLSELIASGVGDLPIQLLIVPDSTLQALARATNAGHDDTKPALMIDLSGTSGKAVGLFSADRLLGSGMPSIARQ
jgi:hypothetical protein